MALQSNTDGSSSLRGSWVSLHKRKLEVRNHIGSLRQQLKEGAGSWKQLIVNKVVSESQLSHLFLWTGFIKQWLS